MSIIYNQPQILGFYIAGLFEGDGHIVMPAVYNKHNPRWHITFHIKNQPLAQKLLSKVGSGFIRYKTKNNACVLTVSSVKGLKWVTAMTNGKFRTPKIYQMHLLIDWLNKHHSASIEKLPVCTKPVSGDSWLAGFIDADGSFGIRYTKKLPGVCQKVDAACKHKQRVSCRFRLEQRTVDLKTNVTYAGVLNLIANYLGVGLNTRSQTSTGKTYYIIEFSSLASITILINYLNAYPLLTAKLLDYNDWHTVAERIINKTHYTQDGLAEIRTIKAGMNMNRGVFNWQHLDEF
uniref:Homing endonuclease LAGLIDADG domain-containing protein n=1 Tax=Ulva sp. TM637 TaxID=2496872 RepID=A0A7R6NFD6_9CHLO|nr:hypothetical protein JXX86_mgp02 [Ulva sp. TM637]AZP40108.1 hypothetical protein [Ulva sp. TM637]